jgi:hypothetical protein
MCLPRQNMCTSRLFKSQTEVAQHQHSESSSPPFSRTYCTSKIVPSAPAPSTLLAALVASRPAVRRSAAPQRRSRVTSAGIQRRDIGAACSNLGYLPRHPLCGSTKSWSENPPGNPRSAGTQTSTMRLIVAVCPVILPLVAIASPAEPG